MCWQLSLLLSVAFHLGEDGMVLKDPKAGSRKIIAVLKLLDKVRWLPLHAFKCITVPT